MSGSEVWNWHLEKCPSRLQCCINKSEWEPVSSGVTDLNDTGMVRYEHWGGGEGEGDNESNVFHGKKITSLYTEEKCECGTKKPNILNV